MISCESVKLIDFDFINWINVNVMEIGIGGNEGGLDRIKALLANTKLF